MDCRFWLYDSNFSPPSSVTSSPHAATNCHFVGWRRGGVGYGLEPDLRQCRLFCLLPAAILFSIARHRGGGVGASLALHGVNNLFATVLHLVTREGP